MSKTIFKQLHNKGNTLRYITIKIGFIVLSFFTPLVLFAQNISASSLSSNEGDYYQVQDSTQYHLNVVNSQKDKNEYLYAGDLVRVKTANESFLGLIGEITDSKITFITGKQIFIHDIIAIKIPPRNSEFLIGMLLLPVSAFSLVSGIASINGLLGNPGSASNQLYLINNSLGLITGGAGLAYSVKLFGGKQLKMNKGWKVTTVSDK